MTRTPRIWVIAIFCMGVAVAVTVGLVVTAAPAASSWCDGDRWADGNTWDDNYLVSDTCDTRGEYVRGVQMITNETLGVSCSAGSVDGYWGPATKAGVQCMQTAWGLNPDGSVGAYTWLAYRTEVAYVTTIDIGGYDYKLYETDVGWSEFFYKKADADWYLPRHCSSFAYLEPFHRNGPNFSNCLEW